MDCRAGDAGCASRTSPYDGAVAAPAYVLSVKNLPGVFRAVQEAGVPERFTHEFLKQLGFTSSADRGVINVMKSMRFLDDSSAPTDRYRRYRDGSIAGGVMAEALRDAYDDLFKINENAQTMSSSALKGAFKRISGKGDSATEKMAATFKALSALADWQSVPAAQPVRTRGKAASTEEGSQSPSATPSAASTPAAFVPTLRHDIHIHLPVADVNVYDAIFRSLRENFG
jgi:hypothetical protein